MFHISPIYIKEKAKASPPKITEGMELQLSIHQIIAEKESTLDESKFKLLQLLQLNDDTILYQRTLTKAVALHTAAVHGKTSCISVILRNLAPIDPLDQDLRTPLFYAIESKHTDAALLLINQGANCCLKDRYKQSLLNLAIVTQNKTLVEALLAKGAAIESADIELIEKLNWGHTTTTLFHAFYTFQTIYKLICDYVTSPDLYNTHPDILFEYFQYIFSQIDVKSSLEAPQFTDDLTDFDQDFFSPQRNGYESIRKTISTFSPENQIIGRDQFKAFLLAVKENNREEGIAGNLLKAMDRKIPSNFFYPAIDIVMDPLEETEDDEIEMEGLSKEKNCCPQ